MFTLSAPLSSPFFQAQSGRLSGERFPKNHQFLLEDLIEIIIWSFICESRGILWFYRIQGRSLTCLVSKSVSPCSLLELIHGFVKVYVRIFKFFINFSSCYMYFLPFDKPARLKFYQDFASVVELNSLCLSKVATLQHDDCFGSQFSVRRFTTVSKSWSSFIGLKNSKVKRLKTQCLGRVVS